MRASERESVLEQLYSEQKVLIGRTAVLAFFNRSRKFNLQLVICEIDEISCCFCLRHEFDGGFEVVLAEVRDRCGERRLAQTIARTTLKDNFNFAKTTTTTTTKSSRWANR